MHFHNVNICAGEKCSAISLQMHMHTSHDAAFLINLAEVHRPLKCVEATVHQIFVEICKTPIISGVPWKFHTAVRRGEVFELRTMAFEVDSENFATTQQKRINNRFVRNTLLMLMRR